MDLARPCQQFLHVHNQVMSMASSHILRKLADSFTKTSPVDGTTLHVVSPLAHAVILKGTPNPTAL
jgi:hypothetical protein